jgi:hypothetical protein
MTSLEIKIEKLGLEVQLLLDKYQLLKKENFNIKQELENLRLKNNNTEEDRISEDVDDREEKNQLNPKFKTELESYISEIDECIKMLKAEQ